MWVQMIPLNQTYFHTDDIHNFILTAGEDCKNTKILSIKLILGKTSGEVCKNNPSILEQS